MLVSSSLVASEAVVVVEWLLALGLLDGESSSEVLGSVEFEGLVEGGLLVELNEGGSFGLSVVSSEQLDFLDSAAGLEQLSDIAVVGLEGKTAHADLEEAFLVLLLNGLWLFLLNWLWLFGLSSWLSSNDWLFGDWLFLLTLAAGLFLGGGLGGLFRSRLDFFLRLLFR